MKLAPQLTRRPAGSARVARHRSRRWRRILAILAAALAVGVGVHAVSPPEPPTETILVAAQDVPAGAVLDEDDLLKRSLPADAVTWQVDSATELTGRTTATQVRAGEPLTSSLLIRSEGVATDADLAYLPVGEAAILDVATAGHRVRLLAKTDGATLAAAAIVHGVVPPSQEVGAPTTGGLWLALTPEEAAALARASASSVIGETAVAVTLLAGP